MAIARLVAGRGSKSALAGNHAKRIPPALAVVAALAMLVGGEVRVRSQTATGQWSPVVDWPLVAVHAALMHTGEVLTFDAWEIPGTPSARVWNPATGSFTSTSNTFAELFCAGHVFLGDGRLFTAGGHNGAGVGTVDATEFDPWSRTWGRLPDMQYARWYPTVVLLGDGRALTFGGTISRPNNADIPEIYDPVANTWTSLTAAQKNVGEYPRVHVTPSGRLFVADQGPSLQSWLFDVDALTWTPIGQSPALTGVSVMYRPGHVMMSGGGTGSVGPVIRTTAVIDTTTASPSWRTTSPMAYPRFQHNLVQLPDGKVLAVGGSTLFDLGSRSGVLPAEMWDPASETWTTMASMAVPRMYHSTALLLPDGRVLSAGGGRLFPAIDYPNAQIYSPPYLFQGARPVIDSAPSSVAYGSSFTVQTGDAGSVSRVTLVRPSSVTHTADQDQRFVELSFSTGSGQLTVQAPSSPHIAPPGHYMLFLLNGSGVPSVARFVHVGGTSTTPRLSINDVSVVEGTGGSTTATFTVTLSSASAQTVTVAYASANGTAIAGSDYTAVSGTLTFSPGVTSRTIDVPITPDASVEPNETFSIVLSGAVGATIADGLGVGTIVNDDAAAAPTLSIGDVEVTEGTGGITTAVFTVTLSSASGPDVLVSFATAPGTATAGADYTTTIGTLTFAGGTTVQTIQVPIVTDSLTEPDETFSVVLSNPQNAVIADGTGICTIRDDDAAGGSITATFSVDTGSDDANEDGTSFTTSGAFWVGNGSSTTASYAGLRFRGVNIPRASTISSAYLEVNAAKTQWLAMGFEIGVEAAGHTATFSSTARPSQRPLLATRVSHASNRQWVAGTWYALDEMGPAIQELVNRSDWTAGNALSVVLRGTGGAWGRKFVTGFEADPARAPRLVVTYTTTATLPSLAVNDVTVTEGTGGTSTAVFAVTLSSASSSVVTVDYVTSDDAGHSHAGHGPATGGSDYTPVSGTLTFNPGTTSRTVAVPINPDSVLEGTEEFALVLSNATNATIADALGVATILDDDAVSVPGLSINDVSVSEGTTGITSAVFTVSLSFAHTQTVTVAYETQDGDATQPDDYTQTQGTLTFEPGRTSHVIAIPVMPDALQEADETFTVRLLDPMNATLIDDAGIATIVDDDTATGPVTVTFSVVGGADDANEDGTSFSSSAGSAWLGNGSSATASFTGLRFGGVTIPRGARIDSAYVEVNASATQWITMRFDIAAEAGANAAPFSSGNRPSQRTLLGPRVAHVSNSSWTTGTWYRLDEIAPLIQDVVNQQQWTTGNALALILRGTGNPWSRKFIHSFDADPAKAPRLVVTYSAGTP